MPRIAYESKKFGKLATSIVQQANSIIRDYMNQEYSLTLRQLYYQFVSRDWFPEQWKDKTTGSTNNERSYKKLGAIISDARRTGLIDWDSIIDRTRNTHSPSYWESPSDIVETCAKTFSIDWWKDQSYRPEVWVEKDALIGVLEVACNPWYCPYFSCRGYTSDSEIWRSARKMLRHRQNGQTPIVLHFGDHDPSGMDMSRDITDRLNLFSQGSIEVKRIALNMDQVEQYNPPPNPAKTTDSRFDHYNRLYGDESWELDALDPRTITDLIAREMNELVDKKLWKESQAEQDEGRKLLGKVSKHWAKLTKYKIMKK